MNIRQILLVTVFLSIASIYDLWKREVPNKLWLIFLPLSIINTALLILESSSQFLIAFLSIIVTSTLAITIFYLGLYGGADAKALITLAVAHPVQIDGIVSPIFPLSVFNNSVLLMTFMIPAAVIKNLYWRKKNNRSLFKELENQPAWKKMAALIFCLKLSKSEIKNYHVLAERIEKLNGEERRTLKIFTRVEDEEKNDSKNMEEAFVTYSLPMLPFLTLGYLFAVFKGDFILSLVSFILQT